MMVRHLKPGERLEGHLDVPFPQPNPDWVWVACDPEPQAVLYGCDMQGIAQLVALRSLPGAPNTVVVTLFCEVMRDLKQRGYKGMMTFLDSAAPAEIKMGRMIKRLGGTVGELKTGWFAAAPIPERHRRRVKGRVEEQPAMPENISDALRWVLEARPRIQ